MKIDLSRPDIVYGLIWGATVLLLMFVPVAFVVEFQPEVLALIIFNIVSFWVIYAAIQQAVGGRPVYNVMQSDSELDSLSGFVKVCILVWLPLYLLSIFLSGGMPVFWRLTGDPRTYVDFGVPTMTGLLNMLRAFIFAAGLMLYFHRAKQRVYLVWPAIMIVTSVLELSRGNMTVMLMHGVGMYLIYHRNVGRLLVSLAALSIVFVLAFGILADIRGAHPSLDEGLVGDQQFFLSLPSGFFWVYSYLVSPVNNLNFAVHQGLEPFYYPYFSLQAVVPTIVRNVFFEDGVYPVVLANEVFNATSYYSVLLTDFGFVGTAIVVMLLQAIVSYFHVKALRGSIYHLLVYPVFYMCVVMSIFYMYFFSLVTILYPVLVMAYVDYRRAGCRGARLPMAMPNVTSADGRRV